MSVLTGLLLCPLLVGGWVAAGTLTTAYPDDLPVCSESSGFLSVSPFFDEDETILETGRNIWRTTDGDITWQAVFPVPTGYSPRVIRIAPVRSTTGLQVYLSYLESSTSPYAPQFSTHSADGGETWETPWPDQLTGSCMEEGVTNRHYRE